MSRSQRFMTLGTRGGGSGDVPSDELELVIGKAVVALEHEDGGRVAAERSGSKRVEHGEGEGFPVFGGHVDERIGVERAGAGGDDEGAFDSVRVRQTAV